MDQESGNTDGRKDWRERLGIKKTQLPKLSEAYDVKPGSGTPAQPGEKTPAPAKAAAGEQPVAAKKTGAGESAGAKVGRAPMAPRSGTSPMAPRQPAATPPVKQTGAEDAPAAKPEPAAKAKPLTNKTPETPAERQDQFAERLKQQRDAAEKLAQQRFQHAKDSGSELPRPASARRPVGPPPVMENGTGSPLPRQRTQHPPQQPAPQQPRRPSPLQAGDEETPRFTFAPKEMEEARRETIVPPPIGRPRHPVPNRPGGRPAGGMPQRPAPPPPMQQRPRTAPPPPPRPAADSGEFDGVFEPQRRRSQQVYNEPDNVGLDGYPRSEGMRAERVGGRPRRNVPPQQHLEPEVAPMRPAGMDDAPLHNDQFEELFDEHHTRAPSSPRLRTPQRARVDDYADAFDAFDDEFYDEEPRQRRGTGRVILILLSLLILLGVLAVAGYFAYNNLVANQQGTGAGEANVPVISGPTQATKREPQATNEVVTAPSAQPAAPQGGRKQIYDRIIGEDTLEESRVVPSEEAPAQPVPAPVPPPDAPQPDTNLGTDGDPLPLPPPPSIDQQGSLDPAGNSTIGELAAAAATPSTGDASSGINLPLAPLPAPAATAVPEAATQTVGEAGTTQAEATPGPAPPLPRSKPQRIAALAANSRRAASNSQSFQVPNQQPVNLTQPSQFGTPTPTVPTQPSFVPQQGNNNFAGLQPPAGNAVPQVPQAVPSDGAYVLQFASYRSQREAEAEFQRLRRRHGQLLGNLTPQIKESSLGQAGSFYRLGVGTLPNSAAARQLCNQLIAAGERDCLVRRQ